MAATIVRRQIEFCKPALLALVFTWGLLGTAAAHEALPTASQPWTYDADCCDVGDCQRVERELQASFVEERFGGWYIKPLDELIPFGSIKERASKDSYFHWCKCDRSYDSIPCTVGKTRCLYVPGAGM